MAKDLLIITPGFAATEQDSAVGSPQQETHGDLSREQVLRRMARGKILAQTSSYGSHGCVIDEALINDMSIFNVPVCRAAGSERWRVTSDHDAMVRSVCELVDHPPARTPLDMRPVERMAHRHLEAHGLV